MEGGLRKIAVGQAERDHGNKPQHLRQAQRRTEPLTNSSREDALRNGTPHFQSDHSEILTGRMTNALISPQNLVNNGNHPLRLDQRMGSELLGQL